MLNLSTTQKDFIQSKTVKDSGVFAWESYHSEDNSIRITNINLGGSGWDADRVYSLFVDEAKVLVSKDSEKILDKYAELMINKYKLEKS